MIWDRVQSATWDWHTIGKDSISSFLTQHLEQPVSVHMQRNEVNWAKNDRVRAVFVDEVKILEKDLDHLNIIGDEIERGIWGGAKTFFLVFAYTYNNIMMRKCHFTENNARFERFHFGTKWWKRDKMVVFFFFFDKMVKNGTKRWKRDKMVCQDGQGPFWEL